MVAFLEKKPQKKQRKTPTILGLVQPCHTRCLQPINLPHSQIVIVVAKLSQRILTLFLCSFYIFERASQITDRPAGQADTHELNFVAILQRTILLA